MMVNAEKKAINIGAMNVKYNFLALDFSLSPRMMIIIITTMGKSYITKESHQVLLSGRPIAKFLLSCQAASGEKRGAENWRCINIIKIKYDGWQLL